LNPVFAIERQPHVMVAQFASAARVPELLGLYSKAPRVIALPALAAPVLSQVHTQSQAARRRRE
jgi:hypothetical protein